MPNTKRRTHMCPASACDTYGFAEQECPYHLVDLVPVPKRKRTVKQETEVEAAYMKDIEDNGGECLKFTVPGRQGYPDRLVLRGFDDVGDYLAGFLQCSKGYAIELAQEIVARTIHFTELKKHAKSEYQPRQPRVIARLRKMGYRVDVVHG